MRSSVDTSLVGGFTQAGSTLDTSLSNALKKGTSGFSDLREAGISALAAIAAQATGLLGTSSGGSSGITSLLSAVSGLPGRPPEARFRRGRPIWWVSAGRRSLCPPPQVPSPTMLATAAIAP
jgi:hypothetical protein